MDESAQSDSATVIGEYRVERAIYLRQWTLWLGLGSAGAEIALVSLASSLPNPDYAFQIFLPSLWAFLVGVIFAAISLLFASFRAGSFAQYFADIHNRDESLRVAKRIPEVIAAPQSLAERENRERNQYIGEAEKFHDSSEKVWKKQLTWSVLISISMTISGVSFLFGVAWPLLFVTFGGSLTP